MVERAHLPIHRQSLRRLPRLCDRIKICTPTEGFRTAHSRRDLPFVFRRWGVPFWATVSVCSSMIAVSKTFTIWKAGNVGGTRNSCNTFIRHSSVGFWKAFGVEDDLIRQHPSLSLDPSCSFRSVIPLSPIIEHGHGVRKGSPD